MITLSPFTHLPHAHVSRGPISAFTRDWRSRASCTMLHITPHRSTVLHATHGNKHGAHIPLTQRPRRRSRRQSAQDIDTRNWEPIRYTQMTHKNLSQANIVVKPTIADWPNPTESSTQTTRMNGPKYHHRHHRCDRRLGKLEKCCRQVCH